MAVNIGTEVRYRAVRAAPPCRIVAIFSAAEPELARYTQMNDAGSERTDCKAWLINQVQNRETKKGCW